MFFSTGATFSGLLFSPSSRAGLQWSLSWPLHSCWEFERRQNTIHWHPAYMEACRWIVWTLLLPGLYDYFLKGAWISKFCLTGPDLSLILMFYWTVSLPVTYQLIECTTNKTFFSLLLLKIVKLPFGFWISLLVKSFPRQRCCPKKKKKKESCSQTSTTLLFTAENIFQGTCQHLPQLLPTT